MLCIPQEQRSTCVLLFTLLFSHIRPAFGSYVIQDEYTSSNFLDMFDFFTGTDPTQGYVNYVDQATAEQQGLMRTDNGTFTLGVDSTNVAGPNGRSSVRVTSKKSYSAGLIIADIAHMPASTCGTWPAFWTVGQNWPHNGEIDIIEGVNSMSSNQMTLHTGPDCTINQGGNFTGQVKSSNCYVDAPNQGQNAGCGIAAQDTTTYGDGFNAVGGGVYVAEIAASHISIYHFARNMVPADIASGRPDPSSWTPVARFAGGCDFATSVRAQSIVINTDFCGSWAGSVFSSDTKCAAKAATCSDYVKNNPADFRDSYWQFNSIKVYGDDGTAATPVPAVSSRSTLSTIASPPQSSPNTIAPPPAPLSTSTSTSQLPVTTSYAPAPVPASPAPIQESSGKPYLTEPTSGPAGPASQQPPRAGTVTKWVTVGVTTTQIELVPASTSAAVHQHDKLAARMALHRRRRRHVNHIMI